MHKTLIGLEPLRIIFHKVDGFNKFYVETRYLPLFGSQKYDAIYNKIRYLMSLKLGILYVFSLNHPRIKIDSHNVFPREVFPLHVFILIKSVLNKNKNHYYYNILLENCLYEFAKK